MKPFVRAEIFIPLEIAEEILATAKKGTFEIDFKMDSNHPTEVIRFLADAQVSIESACERTLRNASETVFMNEAK